jgi:STAS domain.
MKITQRQAVSLSLGVLIVGDICLMIALVFIQLWVYVATTGISALITVVLLIAHLRGWKHAASVIVVFSALMLGFVLSITPAMGMATLPLPLIIPPALALALTRPRWIVASAILSTGIYLVRAITSGWMIDVSLLIIYVVLVLLLLARAVLNTEVQRAEESRQRAEEAQARIEEQAHALEAANAAQQAQLEEQRRLLDLVATLETPAITLAEDVLFAPVVGHLDSRRSAALTARLLEAAHRQRANHVIIDIAGVSTVDSTVAQALIRTACLSSLLAHLHFGCTRCSF